MNQGPPDPHAPESQPTRRGRRLIRILFRSGVEDAKTLNGANQDCRTEDVTPRKQPIDDQANKDKLAPIPETTSKFASLKRKLFPSQNRRHPRHVPPLINPINAPVKFSLPPLGENLKRVSCNSTPRDEDSVEENQLNSEPSSKDGVELKFSNLINQEVTPESDFCGEGDNNWGITGERTLIDDDDDDDRDLESAVEALDMESSIADKTLEEMSKAITDLREWKVAHEQETQQALNMLKQERQPTFDLPQESIDCAGPPTLQLELKIQKQQQNREAQVLEFRKEAEAYQLECSLFKTELNECEATRVQEALQNSSDSEGVALSQLRNDLFQLDVKQRQDNLLQELQEADTELDMNVNNAQAFASELDAILAQFDN
ncbi:hypothetical protein V7S43_002550 [Phytophthora oleae]|uniref:Uncharacterized protein n=1 Tax=Phytophthora oleae TaxID=2107226 RepID=A0ABD3FY90_9STRA